MGLQLEDGRWLKVQAAAELIVEVRHKDLNQLMRLAWHLGNRHLPTEIRYQVLRIRPDHVIEDMLHGFGADLVKVQASRYPKLFQYVDNSKSQGLKLGYVERDGIRRYFDGFGSSSLEKRSKAQFVACRWLLQC